MVYPSKAGDLLIHDILNLNPHDKLLIIFDAFGYKIAETCSEIATGSGIPFCARFIPRAAQLHYAKTGGLPDLLFECIKESNALIFAVSDHEACTKFRAAMLTLATKSGLKILHLPGVDFSLFNRQLHNVDIQQLKKDGAIISEYFRGAKMVEIITQIDRKDGKLQKLLLPLDQFREIHLDVGTSRDGQIAQLPPGEVYLAPKEFISDGEIVINGSGPERVFTNDDVIILKIKQGCVDISHSHFSETMNGMNFKGELIKYEKAGKLNITLGELGIGLNRTISRLTGRPICDEKVYGTAHIALGANTPFGGNNDCDSHIDLIFLPVEIRVDEYPIPIPWGIKGR
jgi:hypothetical protein